MPTALPLTRTSKPLNTCKDAQRLKVARSLVHMQLLTRTTRSGYINYPAGGLCYRDARMRYLITWTSPIVYHAGDDTGSMGVYGVEGSKPGASAVATWLTHKTLGLTEHGYGRLLGEAVFTCTKVSQRTEHSPDRLLGSEEITADSQVDVS